jgi:hypothetical protein
MKIAELLTAAQRCDALLAEPRAEGRARVVVAAALLLERLRDEYRRSATGFDGHIPQLRSLADRVARAIREDAAVQAWMEEWARDGNNSEVLKSYLRRTFPALAAKADGWVTASGHRQGYNEYSGWGGVEHEEEEEEEEEWDYSIDYEPEEDEVQEPETCFEVDPDFAESRGMLGDAEEDTPG